MTDKRKIEKALAALNVRRGFAYPDKGYSYFADVRGDGVYKPRVYVIVNASGGVSDSFLNGTTRADTLAKILAA